MHWDRCGANKALTQLTAAEIWSGELTREWILNSKRELMVVLPGHGPVIENVAEELDGLSRKLDQFEQKPAKLVRHLLAGIPVAAVLELDEPLNEQYFFDWADRSPWAKPYASIMEIPIHQMIRESLDYLLAQGALYQVK